MHMKAMKGRFLQKLSFLPTISTLKQGLVLQLHPPVHYKEEHTDRANISQHVKAFKNCKKSTSSDSDSDDLPFLDAESEPEAEEYEDYECVVLYTTSFMGIRKTYEDCNAIRFLVESLGVKFLERDVSMDLEFREELWRALGGARVIPPRLFVRGRCVGGAEEVVALHEQGKLRELFRGLPLDLSDGPCVGCRNVRFVVCPNCHGSCKIVGEEESVRCTRCNENGLAKCSTCR